MNLLQTYLKGDRVIWIIVILISIMSLLSVYSAAGSLAFKYKGGNTEYYLFQRIVMIGVGLGIMYMAHRINYTLFSKLSVIGLVVAIPLLFLTLVMGDNINDASRWFKIPGIPISFQTSDFAKMALIIYVARTIAKKQNEINDLKKGFLPIAIPVCIVCGLILPANFSTSALLFLICLSMMFIGRVPLKFIFGLIGSAIVGFSLLIGISFINPKLLPRLETWKNRLITHTEDDSEGKYQVEYAKMMIAQGGLIGTGPGNNLNKYRLPQAYSDFIYANIIGEYGFILGGVLILFAYLTLFFRIIKIATKSEYAFATFVTIGLGLSLIMQAFVNMCVAVNIIPVTGQPLPMISMGGTSTIFTGLTLGIILSVSQSIQQKKEVPDGEVA